MKVEPDIIEYMEKSRLEFCKSILKYFPHEINPELATSEQYRIYKEIRVACEDLLICFDQMQQLIKDNNKN